MLVPLKALDKLRLMPGMLTRQVSYFFLLQCFSLWSQGLSWMEEHDKIWLHEDAFMFFCQSLCFPTLAYADSWQREGSRTLAQDHEEKLAFIIKVCEFASPSASSSYIISWIKIFICHRQQKFDVPRPSALFSNTRAILIWPCSYSMFLTKKCRENDKTIPYRWLFQVMMSQKGMLEILAKYLPLALWWCLWSLQICEFWNRKALQWKTFRNTFKLWTPFKWLWFVDLWRSLESSLHNMNVNHQEHSLRSHVHRNALVRQGRP